MIDRTVHRSARISSTQREALVAQLAEATVSNTVKCRFESDLGHQ